MQGANSVGGGLSMTVIKIRSLFLCALVLAVMSGSVGAQQKGKLKPLHIALANHSVSMTAIYVAKHLGIFESYGQHRETPTYHYGARFWVVPDRFQVDMTHGEQTGAGNRRFYTVGLRFLFP